MTLGIIFRAPYGTIALADRRQLAFLNPGTVEIDDTHKKVLGFSCNGRPYVSIAAGSVSPIPSADGKVNLNLSMLVEQAATEASKCNLDLNSTLDLFRMELEKRIGPTEKQKLINLKDKMRRELLANIEKLYSVKPEKVQFIEQAGVLLATFRDNHNNEQKLVCIPNGARFVIAGYTASGDFEVAGTSIPGIDGPIEVKMNPCQDKQFSFTTVGEDRVAIDKIPKVKWGDLEQNLAIAKLAEIIYNTSRVLEKEGRPSVSKSSYGLVIGPHSNNTSEAIVNF